MIQKILRLQVFLFFVVLASCGQNNKKTFSESDINLIPAPTDLQLNQGSFLFDSETKFVVGHKGQEVIVRQLAQKFMNTTGWNLEILTQEPANNYVKLVVDATFEEEAYRVEVTDDKVIIRANGPSGFLYGLQTIRQLLPPQIESESLVENIQWELPNVVINDKPRFKWRGLMLDVSRHFFEKEYILKTIDRLALLKMNTLHLHLVDDQGWRIEIKKYPKLTKIGGFRVDQEEKPWNARPMSNREEEASYGGFYTQEDIKEIVAYASSRGVMVVPEIEMPAHVMSAIAAYPELACYEKPIMVPSGGIWPITDIYCVGKESTFEFIENVLTEVMQLFPSTYIHIGGDEATKTNWKTCSHCKKRMKDEGLENAEALQSYFIRRIERFISAHNRILIGWDEILEGGLAPGATVMSWRGVKGGLEASEQGHDVVMTPGTHCYFDHYQGDQDMEPQAWGGYTPLSKVYEFDPIVDAMSSEQAKHVLGGQANLWSEFVPTTAQSEYMIFPRLAALAETVWSTKEKRNWDNFSHRIEYLFERFAEMGINYAKSSYQITADTKINMDTGKLTLSLQNEFSKADIRYVLNDGDLATDGIRYKNPIHLEESTIIRSAMFKNDTLFGPIFKKHIRYHKATGKKVTNKKGYHDSYQGAKEMGMVNVLRGSKNFHDGQWQAWLDEDMEVSIDLGAAIDIEKVSVGSMENQGSGIYYPVKIEILLSSDGKAFTSVGLIDRAFKVNGMSEIKDFEIAFDKQSARYVKIKARNLDSVRTVGGSWLFVDEIVVE
ncbi:MAG: beta-N-acetylhexosaminidase [Flavobacteriaceae bacterium]